MAANYKNFCEIGPTNPVFEADCNPIELFYFRTSLVRLKENFFFLLKQLKIIIWNQGE